jgi:predicted phage tail protein
MSYSGNGGGGPTVKKDTLFSQDIVELVLSFGEGTIYGLEKGLESFYIGTESLVEHNELEKESYRFPDFAMSFRQGYEDDTPIEFIMGGEASIIPASASDLPAGVAKSFTTPSNRRGTIKFLDIRIFISSLYAGNKDGDQWGSTVALRVRYRPVGETDWTNVSYSLLEQLHSGRLIESVKQKLLAAEGINYDSLTPDEKRSAVRKYTSIIITKNMDIDTLSSNRTQRGSGAVRSSFWAQSDGLFSNIERGILLSQGVDPDSLYTITGKTTTGYVHELSIPVISLPDNDWEIEVTRMTRAIPPTDKNSSIEVAIDSIAMIGDNSVVYPRVATAHIIAQHTDRFSTLPDFSCDIMGIMCDVPVNYNPFEHTYDGVWLGGYKKTWTNNPVWILRELIMNLDWGDRSREPNIDIDDANFYEAAQYCDEKLPDLDNPSILNPRHTFNTVLTDYQSSDEFKRFLAGSFRAVLVERNGKYSVFIDRPKEVKFLITPEMVTVDGIQYSTTDLSSRYNLIKVSYLSKEAKYEQDTRVITDQSSIDKYGVISTDITAVGVTNKDEALRQAAHSLLTNKHEVILCSFKIPRLGLYLQQYDNFYVADRTAGWGESARVYEHKNSIVRVNTPTAGFVGGIFTLKYLGISGIETLTVEKKDPFSFLVLSGDSSGLFFEVPFTLESEEIGYPKRFRLMSVTDDGQSKAQIYTVEASMVYQEKYEQINNLYQDSLGLLFSADSLTITVGDRLQRPIKVSVSILSYATIDTAPVYRMNIVSNNPKDTKYRVVWYLEDDTDSKKEATVQSGSQDGVVDFGPAYQYKSGLVNFEVTPIAPSGDEGETYYLLNQDPPLSDDYSGMPKMVGILVTRESDFNPRVTTFFASDNHTGDYILTHPDGISYMSTPNVVDKSRPFETSMISLTGAYEVYDGLGLYTAQLEFKRQDSSYSDFSPKLTFLEREPTFNLISAVVSGADITVSWDALDFPQDLENISIFLGGTLGGSRPDMLVEVSPTATQAVFVGAYAGSGTYSFRVSLNYNVSAYIAIPDIAPEFSRRTEFGIQSFTL